jgi:rRNA biogenesis protein RRP5
MQTGDDDDDESSDDDDDDSDDDDDDESDSGAKAKTAMDTDVGFNWGAAPAEDAKEQDDDSDSDSDSGSDDDDDEETGKTGHSSRKRAAARRQEEMEISKREKALADGTADENPETSADFERLLASEPNNSERWIRYMAYYLSLADMEGCRRVATRAFDRIDFRQEGEKLNVWTALLTMELKFGGDFEATIDRACQQNNPKQVYLRVCELLEKEVDAGGAEAVSRANNMYQKMCKTFKSKKTVWIAHLSYLLKHSRHQAAHALLKRALLSLPEYKHIETMSKLAQLEFEHGSVERGRTVFDGILSKYPKRLDLLFVFVDKEIKAGEVDAARGLLKKTAELSSRLTDKQMKKLFRKWMKMEEEFGTDESQEDVKNVARAYVERTSK